MEKDRAGISAGVVGAKAGQSPEFFVRQSPFGAKDGAAHGRLRDDAADASASGIRNGDRVRAFNGRGEIVLEALVDGAVSPGVVAARLDWAQLSPDVHNINVLTSEKLTDMGNAATFYSVCVEVELFWAKLGECK